MDLTGAVFIALGVLAIPEDDKKMHFVAGATAAHVASHYNMSPLQSCGVALAAGLAKEAYDSKFGGTVDIKDVGATVLGCGVTFRF